MITFENLTFRYDRRHEVVREMSLRLGEGHIHGLLGCNGVGKTTMLRLMCGLLRPDSGSVAVDGRNAGERSPELLADLFFFPDEVSLPDIPLTRYVSVTGPFYPRFSFAEFEGYCEQLKIDKQARPARMSMGERKKGYLAFALACNARYLLMDEPTNGLDIPSKTIFRRLLANYANEERTVVLSTHQVREIEELIDNVVICDKQGVVLDATISDLAECLSFGPLNENAPAYYREAGLTGDVGIAANTTRAESRPRLEMLFNAVTADRNTIPGILNAKSESHE